MSEIDAAAAAYVRGQRRDNTKRSYATAWKEWCRYCKAADVSLGDVSPGVFTGFALWLERGRPAPEAEPGKPAAPSTIRQRLYGAVTALRDHDIAVPAGVTEQANEAVKAYERRLARDGERRGTGSAPAVTVKHLRAMCAEIGSDTLTDVRDRAILLVGFAIAARRTELAHLHVADITDDPNGLVVEVRYTKTEPRTVAVPYGTRQNTCPVQAWRAWRDAARLTGGRAFRSIDRHGNLGETISGQAVSAVVTDAADRAGLMVRFTGHSLRRGLATEARRTGHDTRSIAEQGGWSPNSAVLFGYMQIVDRWNDNPLDGIGL